MTLKKIARLLLKYINNLKLPSLYGTIVIDINDGKATLAEYRGKIKPIE